MMETHLYLRPFTETTPRTLGQAVIFLVLTSEMPGSDLARESWYLDPAFRGFLSPSWLMLL